MFLDKKEKEKKEFYFEKKILKLKKKIQHF
jgi:hypothetical protein